MKTWSAAVEQTNIFSGLSMVQIRLRRNGCRVSRTDWRTRHGCRDIQDDAKDIRQAGDEI